MFLDKEIEMDKLIPKKEGKMSVKKAKIFLSVLLILLTSVVSTIQAQENSTTINKKDSISESTGKQLLLLIDSLLDIEGVYIPTTTEKGIKDFSNKISSNDEDISNDTTVSDSSSVLPHNENELIKETIPNSIIADVEEPIEVEKESPFEFETSVTGDLASNFSGGVEQGYAYLGNVDITGTFSTTNAGLWKGGTAFVYFLNNHGKSLSQYVGDLQGSDNIESDAHSRLYQLWYEQQLGNFSILIGQHDLNSEFCGTEYGGAFINGSFGIQPDVSGNVPVSIFPVANLATVLKYKLEMGLSFMAGVYKGDPGDQDTNPNSVNWQYDEAEGIMNILEIQYLKEKEDAFFGSYKVGAWFHSMDSSYGVYGIVDQKILSEVTDKNQGLGVFIQLGMAPYETSFIDFYAAIGLNYTGLIKGRNDDVLGLALNYASVPNVFSDSDIDMKTGVETVIEFTYQTVIGEFLTIQPDLQYVINPGANSSLENSFLGILRIGFNF